MIKIVLSFYLLKIMNYIQTYYHHRHKIVVLFTEAIVLKNNMSCNVFFSKYTKNFYLLENILYLIVSENHL